MQWGEAAPSINDDPPVLAGRLRLSIRLLVFALFVLVTVLVVRVTLDDNTFYPTMFFIPLMAAGYAIIPWLLRLELRGTRLCNGKRSGVDLAALVSVRYTRSVPRPRTLEFKGRGTLRPCLHVIDVHGARRRFRPGNYRHGAAFAAAVATAADSCGLVLDDATRRFLERRGREDELPPFWLVTLQRRARRAPPIADPTHPPFVVDPAAPASALTLKRRLTVMGVSTVVGLAVMVVPWVTGLGPNLVHGWYCGSKQALWTTDADVPVGSSPWPDLATLTTRQASLHLAPMVRDIASERTMQPVPSAIPLPDQQYTTVFDDADERVTVMLQSFPDHATALLHQRNAFASVCNSGWLVGRVAGVAGASMDFSPGQQDRSVTAAFVRGSTRVFVTIEMPNKRASTRRSEQVMQTIDGQLYGPLRP